MNAFEHIASKYFEAQGYWTRVGLKIELTKAEKKDLGFPSMPRPEIDIVGFKPILNELLIVECKSYLDSPGVCVENVFGDKEVHKNRMKLFNRQDLRLLVSQTLIRQLREEGLLQQYPPTLKYGLVAGKIKSGHEKRLREIVEDNGWMFIGPHELSNGLRKFSKRGFEDDIVTMVVKILERNVAA